MLSSFYDLFSFVVCRCLSSLLIPISEFHFFFTFAFFGRNFVSAPRSFCCFFYIDDGYGCCCCCRCRCILIHRLPPTSAADKFTTFPSSAPLYTALCKCCTTLTYIRIPSLIRCFHTLRAIFAPTGQK